MSGDALAPGLLVEGLLRAPVGIAILDDAHLLLLVNDVLARLTGLSADEHVGRTFPEVLPQSEPNVLGQLLAVWEAGQPMLNVMVEATPRREPEIRRWFRCSYLPVRMEEKFLAVIAYVEELAAPSLPEIVDTGVRHAGLSGATGADLADAAQDVPRNTGDGAVASRPYTARQMHGLLRLTEAMLGHESLPDLLGVLLPSIQSVLSADIVRLLLIGSDSANLRPRLAAGIFVDFVDGEGSLIEDGLAAEVAASLTPVIIADTHSQESKLSAPPSDGVRSLMSVPVLGGPTLVGVLEVKARRVRAFHTEDLRLVKWAADRIGVAVGAARLAGRLKTVERQAQAVLDTSPDGIVTIDEASRIRSVNRAGCQLFGYREDDLVGRDVSILMPEPHRSRHSEYVSRFLHTGERRILGRAREVEAQRFDGTPFPIELHVTEVANSGDRLFTAVLRDITDRRTEAQLRQQALRDPLTGLANRLLFRDRLNVALAHQQRQQTRVAVLFLDLDRFKVVNDTFGHEVGDRLLKQVADRLLGTMRSADTVARLGGDEFALLAADLDGVEAAQRVASRLLTALSRPFRLQAKDLTVLASVGIAYSSHERSADDLLNDADAALYRAKDGGGNRYEIFDEPLRRVLEDRRHTEALLRVALRHDQIEVFYQPELSLADDRIDCVEALARWRHPERGLLPASEFISVAEETGLIIPLGGRILKLAARQQQAWSKDGPDIAVNLSPQELIQPSAVTELIDVGVDPCKLWVEVTETTLMANITEVAARLQELRSVGVRVAIDDFGTGYSSLSHLRSLPFDAIKIDKAFVDRLGIDPDDTAIVSAVTNLGRQMGIRVIAEGVETERQLHLLTDLGCDYAQGHLIASASTAEEISLLLANPPRGTATH